ncbi:hypothetical protein MUN89_06905 [Halobacillus salinarum]|uniref:Uncharacterized protein n=1 Tax=Halobacillus salinarum TaxID=2932257 RepID=A0ABY4END4_9BACI|nr:hypothetical protein [Halobacillus salinarum]UOQ45658.1 hypothetical protein MUN89_06905 [Halobacillus salinarum]
MTVESSRLPYAEEIAVQDWNHFEMKQGSQTFEWMIPYLSDQTPPESLEKAPLEPIFSPASHTYLHGGHYLGEVEEEFFIEDGVVSVFVDWISSSYSPQLKITGPDGSEFSIQQTFQDSETLFEGAFHHSIELSDPAPGKWVLCALAEEEAYLLSVSYHSREHKEVKIQVDPQFQLSLNPGDSRERSTLRAVKAIVHVHYYNDTTRSLEESRSYQLHESSTTFLESHGSGVYNLTIDVLGKTAKDFSFNRTIVKSIYVNEQQELYGH